MEWTPINDTHEVVDGYRIVWHREGHTHSQPNNVSVAITTDSFILTGLRKYSNYSVSISAFNSKGVGPSGTDVIQTPADGKNLKW